MMAASGKRTPEISLWLGFSYFHKGEYKKAMEVAVVAECECISAGMMTLPLMHQTYRAMLEDKQCDPIVHVYLACSLFFLGLYNEADAVAQKGSRRVRKHLI